ncbi:MAG: outer membrane protein assembly factor BamD [Vicinamibacteria bacterium]|nr:outer membrane protein assembly factor BamD [Vicinamibacteria bacterium]
MNSFQFWTRQIVLKSAILALISCPGCRHSASVDIATLSIASDRALWEASQKEIGKKRWEPARQHLKRIIDGYPRSEYQPLARLALADSYYEEGGSANYILSASEYRDFQTLFPSHNRADYAQFRIAECFFKQHHGADRDQTHTVRAVEEYSRLIDLYPSSPLVEEARKKLKACREILARSEFLVGLFYERTRKSFHSAILRYEHLLEEYPEYSQTDEILLRLANCLARIGRSAEARPHLQRLIDSYPASRHVDSARRLLSGLPENPPMPQSSTSPATSG